MESKMVKVSRTGGSWSGNTERQMTFLEMVHWMNRNHYTLKWSSIGKHTGNRILRYGKEGCNTEYYVTISC